MQNLLLLVAFVYGKNVESLFEDHHFGDDLMYVDSSATLKAEESEARRLLAEDEDEEDEDSAPSTYKPSLLWSVIVGISMIFLPLLKWVLLKVVLTENDVANKTRIQTILEKQWMQPVVYGVSLAVGLVVVFFASETSEEDASDEPATDEDTVPDVARSGYVAKLIGFLPLLVSAFIAVVVSGVFQVKDFVTEGTQRLILLSIMAFGFVAQLVVSVL